MTDRPGVLPFDDIKKLIEELPASSQGPGHASGHHLAWLANWQGRKVPLLRRPVVAVFAASHAQAAVAEAGPSIADIERLVSDAQAQTADVCRVCEAHELGLRVFELAPELPVEDFSQEASLEEADCAATIAYGMEATAGGADLLVVRAAAAGHGASVAAMAAALLGLRDDANSEMAEAAINTHRAHLDAPLEVLRRMGGREHAALAGAILAARMQNVPMVLDGSGALAAALVLTRLRADAAAHCVIAASDGHPDFARLAQALELPMVLAGTYTHTDGAAGALAAGHLKSLLEIASPDKG